jgi:hypothetical protein
MWMKLLADGPNSTLPIRAGFEAFIRSGNEAFQFSMMVGNAPG